MNAWPIGIGIIRCIGVALLEEVCHCGGGLLGLRLGSSRVEHKAEKPQIPSMVSIQAQPVPFYLFGVAKI